MGLILIVCTGNVCRTPMAVGLLRRRLAEKCLDDRYDVFSAGVRALDGERASENSVLAMAERSIDITDHVAHTITADDVARSDLILVMSRGHGQIITQTWPQYAWKVHLLSEMVGKSKDVRDPYGGSLQEYRAAADVISDYIQHGFDRILELA
jgi:protein-tyrosine-phosphatase